MESKPIFVCLVLMAGASFALAEEPLADQSAAVFRGWDAAKYGQISGKVESLLMHREKDGLGYGTSGTMALTLNYLSPEFFGFSLGGQFVGSTRLFDSGSVPSPGYWLNHNDDFSVINEAYLAYDFGELGWGGAEVKVGRQIVNYDFAPSYYIRLKDQSFEAAIWKLEPVDSLRIDVGHLERFSSWSAREGGSGADWRADFIDVEDADPAEVPYSTKGFQFVSAVYEGCEPWEFTVYDFYGSDLYNTFGAKAYYAWDLGWGAGSLTFRTHWANQQDVGRWARDAAEPYESDVLEVGADWSRGGLTLSAGTVRVAGDRFRTPFRTSFTIDTELLWYTDQYLGETESYYLKGVYEMGSWLFYAMWVVDEHGDGTTCQEIDGVIKYQLSESLSTSVKAGYGDRHYSSAAGKKDSDAIDLRWYVTWTF